MSDERPPEPSPGGRPAGDPLGRERPPAADRAGARDVRHGAGADLSIHSPPFSRNTSAWSQRVPVAVLAMVAFFIATWMALYQWDVVDSIWDPFFGDGSETVLDSKVSRRMHLWIGIPDAALGAFAYLGDAVFALAGSTRRWQYRPWLVIVFGIDVIPLGIVSVVLVVLQGTTVGAWCTPCLVTAVISLALIGFAYDEVWASLMYLRAVWKRYRDKKLLWDALWGRRRPETEDIDALMNAPRARGAKGGG